MAQRKPIDFWLTLGSTYSYLTVMRLPEIEEATGISFRWRPFHLLTILQEMKHVPFADKPAKMAYMWRDLERICADLMLPFQRPDPFPQNSLLAARVALVGLADTWGEDFCRGVYRAEFAEGRRIDDPQVVNLRLALGSGRDIAGVSTRAREIVTAELQRFPELQSALLAGRLAVH
jgi:2-hydroxychromene-2-carboxylate isomerase